MYLTRNRQNRNKMWCATDNYNYICHIYAKGFLDLSFILAVIDKISIFTKFPQILHIHKNRILLSIIVTF